MLERNYRLSDLTAITGYTVAAMRKKIRRGELGYRKIGRIVVVPESEVKRLLGEYRPPISCEGAKEPR
jgi:hypothetical protein